MKKEIIICIVIIIIIIMGNYITQNYAKESVQELNNKLNELREEISKEQVDNEKAQKYLKEVEEIWNNRHDKLAYYIEHDELEKVETNMTSMKSFIENKEYPECISELDKSVFILEHIEEKYKFSLENIF